MAISLVSAIASIAIHLVYTPILLNAVGAAQYSIFSFANSITSWLTMLASIFSGVYIKFASQSYKEKGEISTNNYAFLMLILSFTILSTLICLATFVLFACGILRMSELDPTLFPLFNLVFFITMLNVPIRIFSYTYTSYIQYKNNYAWFRLMNLLYAVCPPIVCMVAFFCGVDNIVIVVVVSLIFSVLSLLLNFLYAFFVLKISYKKINFKETMLFIKPMFFYAIWIAIYSIGRFLYSSFPIVLLGFLSNESEITVSTYQISSSLITYVNSFSLFFVSNLYSYINDLTLNSKNESLKKLFDKITHLQTLILVFITGGFIACGKDFCSLWLANDTGVSTNSVFIISVILLVVNLFMGNLQFVSSHVQYGPHYKKYFLTYLIIMIFENILISALLIFNSSHIPDFYLCCLGIVIAVLLYCIVIADFMKKKTPLSFVTIIKYLMLYSLIAFESIALSIGISRFSIFACKSPIFLFLLKGLVFVIVFGSTVFFGDYKFIKDIFFRRKRK